MAGDAGVVENALGMQAQQPQGQQVPTSAPDKEDEQMRLSPDTMKQIQARTGTQEKLQMPGVDPRMKGPSAKSMVIGGALNMFVPFLGTAIMQHSKQQKERQVNEAVNEFQALDGIWDAAWQRAAIESQGDQEKTKQLAQKYAAEDPRLNALFGGPAGQKRLKNFAKVFQQPWMNDGKTTAHTEGLQRFLKLKPASKMLEHMAGIVIGRKQQPQGQPQQAQPQGGQPQQQPQQPQGMQPGQVFQRLPHQVAPADPKALTPLSEYIKATTDWRNRYDLKFGTDGKPFAFDKRHGTATEVKVLTNDGKGGYTPTMPVRGRAGVAIVNGMPIGMYGVMDDGQWGVKTPDSKNWTGADAKAFEAARTGWAAGEKAKDDRTRWSAEWRAKMWGKYARPPMQVYDATTGNMTFATQAEVNAHPEKYAGSSPAMQLTNRERLYNEIQATEDELRRTIANMGDATFDNVTRGEIAAMLKTDNPSSALEGFLKSQVADQLNQAQVEYVTALASMEESALSLRTLGGLGQGSDMMRAAILRMVPGAGTPSGAYAKRQLELFDIELKGLRRTEPGLGNMNKNKASDKKSSDDGKMTFQQYLDQKRKERQARAGQNPTK